MLVIVGFGRVREWTPGRGSTSCFSELFLSACLPRSSTVTEGEERQEEREARCCSAPRGKSSYEYLVCCYQNEEQKEMINPYPERIMNESMNVLDAHKRPVLLSFPIRCFWILQEYNIFNYATENTLDYIFNNYETATWKL